MFNAACMAATLFQHTAARRRLGNVQARRIARRSFNTQPPEGGWLRVAMVISPALCFNTQPPEGGWNPDAKRFTADDWFQHTAARRRLGCRFYQVKLFAVVSTHSRPKAAGAAVKEMAFAVTLVSTHSRPKAAGFSCRVVMVVVLLFQHTAARRRLELLHSFLFEFNDVSTHSRPKAAGINQAGKYVVTIVSTHSRPKAAGHVANIMRINDWFQHTAARRRLVISSYVKPT